MSFVSLILETIKAGSLFSLAYIAYCMWVEYKNTPNKVDPPRSQKPRPKPKAGTDWQPVERKFRAKVYDE